MNLLRSAAIREIEATGLAATPPGTLMARASQAVADAAARMLRALPARTPVLALVGPGNNGGDALFAALELARRGWQVRALALSTQTPQATDAQRAWHAWHDSGRTLATPEHLDAALTDLPLVLDGLFGIGLTRGLTGDAARIVSRLAQCRSRVLAIDLPSGIDADTGAIVGEPGSVAVRADLTLTLIADKPGLHTGAGHTHAGRIELALLGLPVPSEAPSDPQLGGVLDCLETISPWLRPRALDSHKGSFGDVLVVRGASAMQGASRLALLGAQAAGAGRLYLGIPTPDDQALPIADAQHPELMSRRIRLQLDDPVQALGAADAIVIGCGLGQSAQVERSLRLALAHPAALVLDADGLNAVSREASLQEALRARASQAGRTVLTPHPLEAARLLAIPIAAIQADRCGAARALAAATGACVILKGAGSVIALPEGPWTINGSGGPILAVAGTGDVLAGIVGALLAQGLGPFAAARAAAWLHGAAADALTMHAQWSAGIGLPASRLADAVRETLNRAVSALSRSAAVRP